MPGGKPSDKALFDATKRGDLAEVERLLDAGADIEARDKWNTTSLHTACIWGRTPLDLACDLPEDSPAREPLLEIFRDLAPEACFTKFCESQGRMPGRGM